MDGVRDRIGLLEEAPQTTKGNEEKECRALASVWAKYKLCANACWLSVIMHVPHVAFNVICHPVLGLASQR